MKINYSSNGAEKSLEIHNSHLEDLSLSIDEYENFFSLLLEEYVSYMTKGVMATRKRIYTAELVEVANSGIEMLLSMEKYIHTSAILSYASEFGAYKLLREYLFNPIVAFNRVKQEFSE